MTYKENENAMLQDESVKGIITKSKNGKVTRGIASLTTNKLTSIVMESTSSISG